MGIRETLGMGSLASWTYVGEYLRDQYIKNPDDVVRRDEARKRDLYHDGKGDEFIKRMIWVAFEDNLTRKLRGDLVAFAKWDNVLRRISQELATVYSQPATRKVADDDGKYQEFLRRVNQDAVLREADKKLAYHEDVWIQYRVRKDTLEPVLDVVSPAMFWAVCTPGDRTELLAIVLDQTPARVNAATPCYRVWTKDETFQLDNRCRVIVSSVEPNALGRLPGVLASMVPASAKGQLMTDRPAADLVAAHESVWFQNVLLVKESKSANKQTYLSGDTSSATMGQSSDTEREILLPEGVVVNTVDRGMDLTQFRDNANHMRERTAANRGIPPTVMDHKDASSGAEAEMRMQPLLKIRGERILIMRNVERDIAEVQSIVNANDLPEFAFDTEGWTVDFSEVASPLSETEKDAVFEKRRQLGLTNTLDELIRRNPDLATHEVAMKALDANIKVETARIAMMKDMLAMSGSMGASTEDVAAGGKKPFEANRGKPAVVLRRRGEDESTDDEAA
jgi:hypothetical protein